MSNNHFCSLPLFRYWLMLMMVFGTAFANFKCHDAITDEQFELHGDNVLVKLLQQNAQFANDEHMKQFVCDLSEQGTAMEAALDNPAQFKDQPPMAQLMQKMRSAIGVVNNAINGGILVESSELESIKSLLRHSLFFLADFWKIPKNELVPTIGEQQLENVGQENLLTELAKLWDEFKRQNWQNDQKSDKNCHGENGENGKRMLQLMMELSNCESSQLADTKSAKKRQRRRKKRMENTIKIGIFVVVCLIVTVVIIAGLMKCLRGSNNAATSAGASAKSSSWVGIRQVPMSSTRSSGHFRPPNFNAPAPPGPQNEQNCNIQ